MLTSRRTITSDLDIVVVLPGPPAPYRETIRVDDWVVELFVQTPTSMTYYWNLEIESFKATLLRMCAEGHVLTTAGDAATDIQIEARKRLALGPTVLAEKFGQRALLIYGDKAPLESAVIEVLERAGGPITEGYRVDGEDPDRNSLS